MFEDSSVFINKFFFYWLWSYRDILTSLTAGGGQPNLSQDDLKSLRAPVPSGPEQQDIVAFLDTETARVDTLIEKKRRLLKLLEEKRLAVITHAVTKGVNATAPMKDSGIPWLGQIPAHWQLKRLKFISPKVTVGIVITPSAYYVDAGVPALRGFNIKERRLDLSDLAFISEDANELHSKSKIFEGDLIAVRTGQPGTTAIVSEELDGANCIDLIIIRRSEDLLAGFGAYFANSDAAKIQYGAGSEGALQQHFNIDTAKNLLIALPGVAEQEDIADCLGVKEAEIRKSVAILSSSIDRLTEYRAALITNAVTGKIDVRGFAQERQAAE